MCFLPSSVAVYQAAHERGNVEQVVNAWLADVKAGDFNQALKRFSDRAHRSGQLTEETLQQLAADVAFRGCQSAQVAQIDVSYSANSNQDLPQGTVATVSGTIAYDDGGSGTFQATLERERGLWKLHRIHLKRDGQDSTSANKSGCA